MWGIDSYCTTQQIIRYAEDFSKTFFSVLITNEDVRFLWHAICSVGEFEAEGGVAPGRNIKDTARAFTDTNVGSSQRIEAECFSSRELKSKLENIIDLPRSSR